MGLMEGRQWWQWSHLIWAHLGNKSQQRQYLELIYQLEESIDQIESECEEKPRNEDTTLLKLFWQIDVQEVPKEVVPAKKWVRPRSV